MSIFAKKNEITYERACQGDRSRNSRYNSDDLSLTLVHNPYTYMIEKESYYTSTKRHRQTMRMIFIISTLHFKGYHTVSFYERGERTLLDI